ncbi:MAG: outer membrane beta-barrel protein [Bacteroidota bacterium]
MKKLKFVSFIALVIALFFANTATGQTTDTEMGKDTSKTQIIIKNQDDDDDDWGSDDDWESDWDDDDDDDDWGRRKSGKLRFSMLDIGLSSYLFDGSFELPQELDELDLLYGGSLNINWHVFRQRLPIIKNTAFLEYGISFSWMQYKFANDFEIVPNSEELLTVPTDTELRRNKLKTTFIEVPLMLTITPGRNDNYFISGGVYGGVLVGSKQKIKSEDGDVNKIKDDFNLNKFRYGVEGRIGLGPVSFYAQYSLVDLFREDQGPQLTPINIGLTVLGF